MKFQQQNIDYRVTNYFLFKEKKKYGSKQISRIGEKQYQFESYDKRSDLELNIQFNIPAVVKSIQIKFKKSNIVQIALYEGEEGQPDCRFSAYLQKHEINVLRTKKIQLEEKAKKFTRAVVRFINYERPMQTCISYILFHGYKQFMTKKGMKGAQSRKEEKQIPKTIQKQKCRKTPIEQLVSEVMGEEPFLRKLSISEEPKNAERRQNIIIQKGAFVEDNALLEALEESRKQYEMQLMKKGEKKMDTPEQEYPYMDQSPLERVKWMEVKEFYKNVSSNWIMAQQKEQKIRKIKVQYRLSERLVEKNSQL